MNEEDHTKELRLRRLRAEVSDLEAIIKRSEEKLEKAIKDLEEEEK